MDFVRAAGTAPQVTALEAGLLLQRCGLSGVLHADVCNGVPWVPVSWLLLLLRPPVKKEGYEQTDFQKG